MLLWKYDWKYRKKRKTNEKKLNHRQQQKQKHLPLWFGFAKFFFFVFLVFSFWWFRLFKLKLDAIFICLKIDLGCQPEQSPSYLVARIHIIHLSRSRAFISFILILNMWKYSFKITLYHWPCFSFPIRGPRCQLKVPIQLPPERIFFFLSEN